jgi:hypothetical protein
MRWKYGTSCHGQHFSLGIVWETHQLPHQRPGGEVHLQKHDQVALRQEHGRGEDSHGGRRADGLAERIEASGGQDEPPDDGEEGEKIDSDGDAAALADAGQHGHRDVDGGLGCAGLGCGVCRVHLQIGVVERPQVAWIVGFVHLHVRPIHPAQRLHESRLC